MARSGKDVSIGEQQPFRAIDGQSRRNYRCRGTAKRVYDSRRFEPDFGPISRRFQLTEGNADAAVRRMSVRHVRSGCADTWRISMQCLWNGKAAFRTEIEDAPAEMNWKSAFSRFSASRAITFLALLLITMSFASVPLLGQTPITTWHYDNGRSGADTTETLLTPSNVNTQKFRKTVYPAGRRLHRRASTLSSAESVFPARALIMWCMLRRCMTACMPSMLIAAARSPLWMTSIFELTALREPPPFRRQR